jgi:hypothetical protein
MMLIATCCRLRSHCMFQVWYLQGVAGWHSLSVPGLGITLSTAITCSQQAALLPLVQPPHVCLAVNRQPGAMVLAQCIRSASPCQAAAWAPLDHVHGARGPAANSHPSLPLHAVGCSTSCPPVPWWPFPSCSKEPRPCDPLAVLAGLRRPPLHDCLLPPPPASLRRLDGAGAH